MGVQSVHTLEGTGVHPGPRQVWRWQASCTETPHRKTVHCRPAMLPPWHAVQPESQLALRQAVEAAAAGVCPLYVLFPGTSALDLRQAAAALHQGASSQGREEQQQEEQQQRQRQQGASNKQQQQCDPKVEQSVGNGEEQLDSSGGSSSSSADGSSRGGSITGASSTGVSSTGGTQHRASGTEGPGCPPPSLPEHGVPALSSQPPLYTLLAIDGTWQQAKEMFRGLQQQQLLAPSGPGVRVQLPPLGTPPQEATPAAVQAPAPETEQQLQPCEVGVAVKQSGSSAGRGSVSAKAPVADVAEECQSSERQSHQQPRPALQAQQTAAVAAATAETTAVPDGDDGSSSSNRSMDPGGVLDPGAAEALDPPPAPPLLPRAEPPPASGCVSTSEGLVLPAEPLLVRTEPMPGCMSTCEAVARAVGMLEPPPAGVKVCTALLRPLALMAAHQVGAPCKACPSACLPACISGRASGCITWVRCAMPHACMSQRQSVQSAWPAGPCHLAACAMIRHVPWACPSSCRPRLLPRRQPVCASSWSSLTRPLPILPCSPLPAQAQFVPAARAAAGWYSRARGRMGFSKQPHLHAVA